MTKVWTPVLAAAALTALSACKEVEVKAEATVRPVKVQAAAPLAQESRARYSATIQPDEQVALSLKAGGYVDSVMQRRGADGRMHALQAGEDVAWRASHDARARVARFRSAQCYSGACTSRTGSWTGSHGRSQCEKALQF